VFTKTLTEKNEMNLPRAVRQYSEDFADIMKHDPEIRNQLKQLGVNLEQLDTKLKGIGRKPEVTPGAGPSAKVSTRKLADRIETARGKGTIPAPKTGYLNFGTEDWEDEVPSFKPGKYRPVGSNKLGKIGK
jgi:hypothetical protein